MMVTFLYCISVYFYFYMEVPLLKEIIFFLSPLDVSSSLHIAELLSLRQLCVWLAVDYLCLTPDLYK